MSEHDLLAFLRHARRKTKLSQVHFALEIGSSSGVISDAERGIKRFTASLWRRYANAGIRVPLALLEPEVRQTLVQSLIQNPKCGNGKLPLPCAPAWAEELGWPAGTLCGHAHKCYIHDCYFREEESHGQSLSV